MSRPVKDEYDELALPTLDLDTVLSETWYIPGYYLNHEPSSLCWCDPEIIFDNENEIVLEIKHHEFH